MRLLTHISLLCLPLFVFTQNLKVDSLKQLLKTLPADTQKVNVLYDLGFAYFDLDPNLTIDYGKQGLDIAQKRNSPKHLANCYNLIALGYSIKSDFVPAIDYYNKSLSIRKKLNDKLGISKVLGNMGNIYWSLADYPKALEFQLGSLKLKEELGNKQGVTNTLGNIANIYYSLGDKEKALNYNFACIKIAEEIGNKKNIAICYQNIGAVYLDKKQYQLAIDYLNKSLIICEEIGDKYTMSGNYSNIGSIYSKIKKYELASEFLLKSLKMKNEQEDSLGITSIYTHLAELNIQTKNFKDAEKYYLLALKMSKDIHLASREREILLGISNMYEKLNNTALGFEYYKKYIRLRDTLINLDNNKLIIQKQLKYDYDKKTVADSLKTAEEKKITAFQLKHEKTQKYALYGGLALVLLFSIFIFNRFKVTQKQKVIIEEKEKETQKQKHLIEEKQKEIVDSINYAKRLQEAILPQISNIKKAFLNLGGDAFVLYQPKDIVAGDFYFFEENNDQIFIAAADCTGHGVPGAMVSVVCSNALTRSVKEFNLNDPGKILDKTTELVLDTFSKSVGEVKDGMDISILSIHKKTKVINWSGANNPLWYTNIGNSDNDEKILELKPNKQPIGYSADKKDFIGHQLNVNTGTLLYLITDGYADQFGGKEGKKLKSKNFRSFLNTINSLALDEQAVVLSQKFNEWKGNYEQVDDVCVIGIRI